MLSKISFFKKNLLNSPLFSGILISNSFKVQESSAQTKENIDIPKVVSYISTSWGCCKKWVKHLLDSGSEIVDNIVEDPSGIEKEYNIPNNLRSCHSAKIVNYTIKGDVMIALINKPFKEKPTISVIAFLGMLLCYPGMETHFHDSHPHNYENYKVASFSNIGATQIYDKITP